MRRRLQGTAPYESTTISRYLNSTEQSENVDENKGPARRINHPCPSLSKEGNCNTPPRMRRGEGVGILRPWRSLHLGVKTGLLP
jgi:hypothetical protein